MNPIPLLVIVGPTASGKTSLSIRLAEERDGEVISADSRQVYKGLNIGTGKVTRREMQGIRHHLIDVCSPRKVFSAHDFVRLGRAAIADIHARGKLPILCGGTGFYIDALLGSIDLPAVERDTALRERLSHMTAARLFAMLKKKDPVRARQMDTPSERNNKVRLVRALEVAAVTPRNRNAETINPSYRTKVSYEVEWVYVDWPDDVLKKRIHDRLLARMKSGMVAEVRRLHEKGLSWKRMEELGLEYRYVSRYLRGVLSKDDMLAQLEMEIWHYAKRQRTWWRKRLT